MNNTDWKDKRKTGMWNVFDEYITTPKGEKKYLCRCDCGTERYVLERSLKYGGSQSCGCVAKKNAAKANSHDLVGQTFGELTVLHKAENQRKNGGVWWTCRCSCGNLYDVPATLLTKGRRTHCSNKIHPKNYAFSDITGKKVNRLTVLYPLKSRSQRGAIMWRCKCDCGNEVDVSYNELMYSAIRSCGCQKKEHDAKLGTFLTHIDGTSLDMIKSKKIPSDNTSGAKGVYFSRGKWMAKIVFQQKQYHLGQYDNVEEAIRARQDAETLLFDGVVAHYKMWQAKASQDPEWAKANPIEISVSKKSTNELQVVMLPVIPQAKDSDMS